MKHFAWEKHSRGKMMNLLFENPLSSRQRAKRGFFEGSTKYSSMHCITYIFYYIIYILYIIYIYILHGEDIVKVFFYLLIGIHIQKQSFFLKV
jgi:hypothetical protein